MPQRSACSRRDYEKGIGKGIGKAAVKAAGEIASLHPAQGAGLGSYLYVSPHGLQCQLTEPLLPP